MGVYIILWSYQGSDVGLPFVVVRFWKVYGKKKLWELKNASYGIKYNSHVRKKTTVLKIYQDCQSQPCVSTLSYVNGWWKKTIYRITRLAERTCNWLQINATTEWWAPLYNGQTWNYLRLLPIGVGIRLYKFVFLSQYQRFMKNSISIHCMHLNRMKKTSS